ncbi:MAG: S8 family serine peptidase [Rhizobacter sp.]|nr:S8 family serine peptidase [Chlorobiales bacterium]
MTTKLFRFTSLAALALLLTAQSSPAQDWSFISYQTTGADRFAQAHPEADGRGVIIVIIDTGIDLGAIGLQRTSLGTAKVIDVQNFSGFGDIKLTPARITGSPVEPVLSDSLGTVSLRGAERFPKSLDGRYCVGVFDERDMINSALPDLDGDNESLSRFAVVMFKTAQGTVAVLDTDADGDLSNERILTTYKERFDTFTFKQKRASALSPVTGAINLFPDSAGSGRAVLHFDDNLHGTHCAGIAAGYRINESPVSDARTSEKPFTLATDLDASFDGLAPGAELVSCKITDPRVWHNNSVTGSIKRAFDYAAALSKSQPKPVVVNLSFGVPSVIAGEAEMERYIDRLIETHPNLYVCVSNGNDGPGISSTSLPAAAQRVISVGALLNRDIARDLFSSQQASDLVWSFSSRGGDIGKPDVVAPGSAASTVPNHAGSQLHSGTSMASPYTAGAIARLLSALCVSDPGFRYPQRVVKAALKASASKLKRLTELDYGAGVIQLPEAYNELRKYRQSGFAARLADYTVRTVSQEDEDGLQSSVAYYRTGAYPSGDDQQIFRIGRVPQASESAAERAAFFRVYDLQSTAKWMKPVQQRTSIKGTGNAAVSVVYDAAQLSTPGLYTGKILATAASRSGRRAPASETEFELLTTIAVPYQFTAANAYRISVENEKLDAGELRRYFFAVPEQGSALAVSLTRGKLPAAVSATIIDSRGLQVGFVPSLSEKETAASDRVVSELSAGVYEIVVQSDAVRNTGVSTYSLDVRLSEMSMRPKFLSPLLASVSLSAPEKMQGTLRARITGYGATTVDSLTTSDTFVRPLFFAKGDRSITVTVSVSKTDYNKNTDIAMRVLDGSGKQLAIENLSALSKAIKVQNLSADTSTVYFVLTYGYAIDKPLPEVRLVVDEFHQQSALALEVWPSTFELVPFVVKETELTLPALTLPLSLPPRGYRYRGDLRFEGASTGELQSYQPFILF